MIRLFYINEQGRLTWEKGAGLLEPADSQRIVWVDLQESSAVEKATVERHFGIELFTPQEAAEIESSSRFFEGHDYLEGNNSFILYSDRSFETEQVSFIVQRGVLFTLRNADLKAFALTVKRLKTVRAGKDVDGLYMLLTLIEFQIDLDADFIEHLSRLTTDNSRKLTKERSFKEQVLIDITELQENTILARESIVDKQRLVSSLLKSHNVEESDKERLRVIIKDIGSILQHTQFNFERLEYLQNTFLGLVNIEQNKVIKIFTVVTVIFMPPTLIASIYGMNFHNMPELGWHWGYPFALGLMVIASLLFLWFFKRKRWL
ncbi:MAG: magnesium/cobalt transporter CorA [Chitinophagaceae bacterium]|nr:MAG: magnesium/cobalt transporter CorA [Chitinophagaceae bacterium]